MAGLFFLPLNGSQVNKVNFSNPDTWSWIGAFSNSFCACHAHTRSLVLQTLVIYSAMNLNEGKAVKPSCSCCSDGISRTICQLIKNTYSFQFSRFILTISLSLLNLEIKSSWTQEYIISLQTFIYFNPSRWFGKTILKCWKRMWMWLSNQNALPEQCSENVSPTLNF